MQSKANTETAVNAAELSADEILILRSTDEVAGAVAHLAAARLYALLTSDAEEPGVDLLWFDYQGDYADRAEDPKQSAELHGEITQRITGMASYVGTREVRKAEQLYRHGGGKNWTGESEPYRQALELFCATALIATSGIELSRAAIASEERQKLMVRDLKPLKLEDSIFEPDTGMGEMLEHAVQADHDAAKARKAQSDTGTAPAKDAEPMSVGEAPAGVAKAKAAAEKPKSKKHN